MAGPHRSARDRPPRRLGVPVSHHLASLSRSRSTTNNHSDHTHSSLELAHSSFTSCGAAPSHQPPPRAMDPAAADPPCIIQALRAHTPAPTTVPPPLVQALRAPLHSPAQARPPAAAASSSRPPKRRPTPPPPPPRGPAPPSPRRTRSGGAPEWTRAETLALVAEVAAVDDGWSRSVSAFQKWAMVAENLASAHARRGKRAAAECRRRWEALAAEYGAVRRWEVRTGGTYWEMGAAARRSAGLPAEFDAEVYGAMDALIRVEEALLADAVGGAGGAGAGEEGEGLVGGGAGVEVRGEDGGGEAEVAEDDGKEEDGSADEEEDQDDDDDDDDDGEEEGEEEMQADAGNADAPNNNSGVGRVAETNNKAEKSQNTAWELANKLQENAQHIQTILNEEPDKYAAQNHTVAYSTSPDAMVTTRQKADELIKSLGGLLSYLNQFTELVKETGFENVGMT
ncbi:hypothetical protein QOZ80_2BG0156530 [Eleusine coracana subsp. coracana]|nr:hypothetical protein QOZ80_2BG0156530 [Eleusine coracana subsp. coracana]